MRSRAARLSSGAAACLALGAAAFFLVRSEKQIASRRGAVRAFDVHAREATDALADARAGAQAYVAAGQSVVFWAPKVAGLLQTASAAIDDLRQAAATDEARRALIDAAASVTELGNVEKRARDYLASPQQLMAADVIFAEGVETATAAARQVEAARTAEVDGFDAFETVGRRRQAYGLVASAGLALAIVIALAFVGPASMRGQTEAGHASGDGAAPAVWDGSLDAEPRHLQPPADAATGERADAAAMISKLQEAADLCTEFGRVGDVTALNRLLARGADAMSATGMVVWLGNAAGADLRPVLAHGYTPKAMLRMPPLARSAGNAAAAAYRTAALQVVRPLSSTSTGAVVAPLISAEGCIGALSAELSGGAESSRSVQALATILAAQLAGVLAPSAAAPAREEATA